LEKIAKEQIVITIIKNTPLIKPQLEFDYYSSKISKIYETLQVARMIKNI
jgi:hypothetical protein